MLEYFNMWEFDSPDKKGSGANMDTTLLSMLIDARHTANIPFIINSGYRTKKHNEKIYRNLGKPVNTNSSHLKGLAVDIACSDSRSRAIIINSLISAGFNRIGIAKTFIHCDVDPNKSQNVYWVY